MRQTQKKFYNIFNVLFNLQIYMLLNIIKEKSLRELVVTQRKERCFLIAFVSSMSDEIMETFTESAISGTEKGVCESSRCR